VPELLEEGPVTQEQRDRIRDIAEAFAEGYLQDCVTGHCPGLELPDYIEVAIIEAIEGTAEA
jgi:hypothetical protein